MTVKSPDSAEVVGESGICSLVRSTDSTVSWFFSILTAYPLSNPAAFVIRPTFYLALALLE